MSLSVIIHLMSFCLHCFAFYCWTFGYTGVIRSRSDRYLGTVAIICMPIALYSIIHPLTRYARMLLHVFHFGNKAGGYFYDLVNPNCLQSRTFIFEVLNKEFDSLLRMQANNFLSQRSTCNDWSELGFVKKIGVARKEDRMKASIIRSFLIWLLDITNIMIVMYKSFSELTDLWSSMSFGELFHHDTPFL